MSYITADCLMNSKLFSGDRHNSLMISGGSCDCVLPPAVGHEQDTADIGKKEVNLKICCCGLP